MWARAIILVDMNAFFASVEQLDFPLLQGQPVAVTNGAAGTCLITCSYEAREYGLKTGMRLNEARTRCPNLIVRPSRPARYTQVSSTIMQLLTAITPDIEVFSVDEAFLDVTHCQRLASPIDLAKRAQQLILSETGLPCSVGVSGDKTTAKYAAKQQKPFGFTAIHPDEAAQILRDVPLTELCGIASGIGRFLAERGVFTCGDMKRLPIGVLAKRFGNLGRRIWLMAQGRDPTPLTLYESAPKSVGHGKVLPPQTRDRTLVRTYLLHMCEKLTRRLRAGALVAQTFFVGLRTYQHDWIGREIRFAIPIQRREPLYQQAHALLSTLWQQEPVKQIQITALDPQKQYGQGDLFCETDAGLATRCDQICDRINQRFGGYTITPARLLLRSGMHDVIAPAWRPTGTRQSIPLGGKDERDDSR